MNKTIEKLLGFMGVKNLEQLTSEYLKLEKAESDLLSKISCMADLYMERTSEYNEHKKGDNLPQATEKYNEFSKAHLLEVVESKNDLTNIRKRKAEILNKKPEIKKAMSEYNKRKKISVINRKFRDEVITGETMTSIIKAGIGPVRTIVLLVANSEGKYLIFHSKKTNKCHLPYGFMFEMTGDTFEDIDPILRDTTGLQGERFESLKTFKKDGFLRQYYHVIPKDAELILNGNVYDSIEWKTIPELIADSRLQDQYKNDLKEVFPFFQNASIVLKKAAQDGVLEKVLSAVEKAWEESTMIQKKTDQVKDNENKEEETHNTEKIDLEKKPDKSTIEKAKTKTKYADNIVFNNKGEILLLKRNILDESNPAKFTLPGGHVDPGETFVEAARRELQEESGLSPDKLSEPKEIGTYENDNVEIHYFEYYLKEDTELVIQSEEMQDAEWVSLQDLDKYDMPFNMKDNIKNVLKIS